MFDAAAGPRSLNRPRRDAARPVYEAFCAAVAAGGFACQRGEFGAGMRAELVNDGPVTLILDSDVLRLPRGA